LSSAWLMRHFHARSMLGVYAVINVVLGLIGVTQANWLGVCCILATSFFMSIMFPTIFALGIRDLGEHTKEGASLLVMAIIGGAVFTPLMGLAYQFTKSMALSMIVPLICYAVVGVFAYWGTHLAPFSKALPDATLRGSN